MFVICLINSYKYTNNLPISQLFLCFSYPELTLKGKDAQPRFDQAVKELWGRGVKKSGQLEMLPEVTNSEILWIRRKLKAPTGTISVPLLGVDSREPLVSRILEHLKSGIR